MTVALPRRLRTTRCPPLRSLVLTLLALFLAGRLVVVMRIGLTTWPTAALVSIFCFKSTSAFPAVPGTFNDDGNSILNKGLDPSVFHNLGQYSPRYTVKDDSSVPPLGCAVEAIDSLERHGARYMTASALVSANATMAKIQKALNGSTTVAADLAFLSKYTLLTGTADLVPFGALQAYYSGRSTASVYPLLTRAPPFVRASGDEDLLDDRVILTAKYWRLGFTGGGFPAGTFASSADVRAAASSLPAPQVIFSEQAGQNNTLDVSSCTNENNIPSAQGEKGAQQAYAQTTILPIVGVRLQNRLIASGAKGLNLTGTDMINLASLCSFETLGRATVTNGRLGIAQAPFCSLFNETEWPILGYAFDVGKWTGAGYGNPYYKALGQGFLRELVARFTGKSPPLDSPTSLNSTIDGRATKFPLPNQLTGPMVYFDGSHDNNIGPIAAAASLFAGPALSTSYNAQAQPHSWIFSRIAPLQGKIVFEKLSCLPAQKFVRIRANGAVLDPASYCGGATGDRFHPGLCPLDRLVSQLAYVNEDAEWNGCFAVAD